MTHFPLLRVASGALLLLWAGHGAAQISAVRYIDPQGVEVIVNRDAAMPAAPARPAPPESKAARDPKMRISAAEQEKRDRDRVAILQEELATETRVYAALMQRTQPGAGAEKLSAAEAQRLTEELYGHQKNIQSLDAELRRARAGN